MIENFLGIEFLEYVGLPLLTRVVGRMGDRLDNGRFAIEENEVEMPPLFASSSVLLSIVLSPSSGLK